MTEPLDESNADAGHPLAWAAYLGASWTWVIGMVLPALLVRDFGPVAWLVFAVPNVVGAAAMGWMIRSPEHGRAFVASHRVACQTFSLVTIAFHVYVMLWLVPSLVGPLAASAAFGVALAAIVPLFTTTLRATTLAILTLCAGVLVAVAMLGLGALAPPRTQNAQSPIDLIALGIVCLLGFLTCPYLDLTFHRAAAACRTPGDRRLAFGVGFGTCFASMIVLTFFYANVLLGDADARVARALIGVHLCVQSIFTLAIHAASYRRVAVSPLAASRALAAAIAVAVLLALLARVLDGRSLAIGTLLAGEVGYRTFLAFYGLVAPAYVLICVRRADAAPEASAARTAIVAAIVAAPFFWAGFMHASMRWATPGVAALVAGWIVVTAARRKVDAQARAFKSIGGHLR